MVPIATELLMMKSAYYGHFEDDYDLYKEVMDKSNERKGKKSSQ